MADDNHNFPPNDNPEDFDNDADLSASSLFLEMMRRAASEKHEPPPAPIEPKDLEFVLAPEYEQATPAPIDYVPDNVPSFDDDTYEADEAPEAVPFIDDDTVDEPAYDASSESVEIAPPPLVESTTDEANAPEEDSLTDARFYRGAIAGLPDIDLGTDVIDDSQTLSTATSPEPEPLVQAKQTPVDTREKARVPIYAAPEEAGASETDDDTRAAQLEAQRIRRLRRRQQRRQRRNVGILGGFARTTFIALVAAILASTIFTWFTDPDFFTPNVVTGLQTVNSTSVAAVAPLTPTVIPVTPNWARRIGIVSGHRGPENDPGAVCDEDGLTEAEINFAVAQLVVLYLRERGYSVDLLDEFDPRLEGYQAAALVSIHANDCRDYGEYVSGYLVARAAARAEGGPDDVLAECVARDYFTATNLERRFSLTIDMTDYHTFREIHPLTPAAIIELGFMRDDREILTTQHETLATGITDGILCFLNGENPLPAPTDAFGFGTPTIEPTVVNTNP
ncbi:MAG: N-acetylmuramoyl-L-alanine amidase [Chloroflexota bacterium]